jgi:cytochrome P450
MSLPGPASILGLRSLFRFRNSPLEYLQNLASEYGDIACFPLGKIRAVLVNHPDLIHEVLATQIEAFPKMGRQRTVIRQIDGNSLFVKDGEAWLNDRRSVQAFFRTSRMAEYADKSVAEVKRHTAHWSDDDVVNFEDETIELAVKMQGRMLFDTDLASESRLIREAVYVRAKVFMKEMRAFVRLPDSIPLPFKQKKKWFKSTMDDVIYKMIDQRRMQGLTGDDLVTYLLRDVPKTREGDQQVRDHLNMVLQAAADDVSSAMVWMFYLIARHPETQIRLRKEIARNVGARDLILSDIPKLKFLECVVNETLRLYPPTWMFTTRKARRDVMVGDYAIKHKTWVVVSPYVTQRDARFFDRPDEFRPDRFGDASVIPHQKQAFFPFGMGPRACAAGRFSIMKLTLAAAAVLQQFHLELEPGQETMEAVPLVTVRPKTGVRIRVRRMAAQLSRVA